MYNIFFELIQVALNARGCLSRSPSNGDWNYMYKVAMKQSLVGVCFAGVQRLKYQMQVPPDELYLLWMSMAVKVQQRNETVNQQCVELQARLSANGISSCVIKGQGIAQMYRAELAMLRQSGDIDVWVDASKEETIILAKEFGMTTPCGYLHVGCSFDNTEVELHYRPTYMRSLRHNRRMQEFCNLHKDDWQESNRLIVPSWDFNVVYLLSHIYRHLFGLGVGLRQLMDYYFVLRTVPEVSSSKFQEVSSTLKHLGLYDFAGAVMYVMREVFGMDEKYMICPVDEKRGRMLLEHVMQTGNFGHHDATQKAARSTTVGSMKYKLRQWWELVRFYPEETLSAPLWSILRCFD